VLVTPVLQQTLPIYGEFVGQTESPQTVEIRARVEGFLERINFEEGAEVTENQLLFVIDPRQYKAEFEKAKAQLQRDEASLTKARQDAVRFRSLHEKDAVSTAQFEKAIAREKEAEATVAADRQAVEEARLKLSYTAMHAPVSGRIGRAQVKVGSLVGKGEPTLLATISKTDPIWVNASISEREYLQAIKHYQGRQSDQPPDAVRRIPITMLLADNTIYPHEGRINFVDRTVDPKTGTLPFRVEFPNPDKMLRPGQFARLRAELDRRENALLVPQRAVQELQGLYRVVVVGPDSTARFRPVKLGPRSGELWLVEEGLRPGERVVVEGLQRVQDGRSVQPAQSGSTEQPAAPPPQKAASSSG
jgi:membrane fusion protein (multidrug efflux system)